MNFLGLQRVELEFMIFYGFLTTLMRLGNDRKKPTMK
jgi:hypothetical protein